MQHAAHYFKHVKWAFALWIRLRCVRNTAMHVLVTGNIYLWLNYLLLRTENENNNNNNHNNCDIFIYSVPLKLEVFLIATCMIEDGMCCGF